MCTLFSVSKQDGSEINSAIFIQHSFSVLYQQFSDVTAARVLFISDRDKTQ